MDDEKMALFVKRFGKFMVKKGYRARRKKSLSKNKEESRRCFKCGSKDHLFAQCPYNSDNDCNTLGVWLPLIAFHFINMCIIYLIMPLLPKHAYATFQIVYVSVLECCE